MRGTKVGDGVKHGFHLSEGRRIKYFRSLSSNAAPTNVTPSFTKVRILVSRCRGLVLGELTSTSGTSRPCKEGAHYSSRTVLELGASIPDGV